MLWQKMFLIRLKNKKELPKKSEQFSSHITLANALEKKITKIFSENVYQN